MNSITYKKALRPLQLVIIIILCVVGGLYWYAGQQQQHYDEAATHYLRIAFADIGSWQRAALQRQLAGEALRTINDAQQDAIVERFRPLGGFVQLNDAKFTRLTAALSLLARHRLLSYHGNAQFQNGSADFAATLIVGDDGFHLYNLSFSTPQLK